MDSLGLDIWIEGPNANEPLLHQSVNVGDPNGEYSSYSFGVDGNWLEGEVYEDTEHGGKIEAYKKTTKCQDKAFKQAMDKQLNDKGIYGVTDICRSFSQRAFNEAPGTSSTPPDRVNPPPGPNNHTTLSSTTTRGSSTTGTWTSK